MVLKTLFRAHSQERDSGETAVDVEAARLVAQKLGENGIGGESQKFSCDSELLDFYLTNNFRNCHTKSSKCKGSGAGPSR